MSKKKSKNKKKEWQAILSAVTLGPLLPRSCLRISEEGDN